MQRRALGDGIPNLLVKRLSRLARRQGRERALGGLCGIAGLEILRPFDEPVDEAIEDLFGDDDPLVRVTGLSGIANPGVPGQISRRLDVIGVQHHVGVGATELQDTLLEVATRDRRDDGPRAFRSGQRHPDDAAVTDHGLDLPVGGEDVDVRAFGNAGLIHEFLHGQRRLRHRLGMLEDDRVAQHQVWGREARDLIEGVVPRHDAQQRPDREFLHVRLAAGERLDFLIGRQTWALRGEVVEDVAAEVGFAHRFGKGLAHFLGRDGTEARRVLLEQLSDPGDDPGPLGYGQVPPGSVRCIGRSQRRLDLGIGREVERLSWITGGGIDYLVPGLGGNGRGHDGTSLKTLIVPI